MNNYKKSEAFRREVHQFIPGGCHTYSKGDDTFPSISPAAISHGKGAYVWDIDGNKFLDCTMGLTSVTIGHAIDKINKPIIREINRGVNFQRPSYIELEYAKEFLKLVPQHNMIKFAKNGSTVTTAAVKLARAYTGRKLIAVPNDHPFYSYDDWFIGTTKCSFGVPSEVADLSIGFKSSDLESLNQMFKSYPNQIAGVIMEHRPCCDNNFDCKFSNKEYLTKAANIIHKNGSIFILDEMITGFKAHFPGVTSYHKIDADITTWGKSISNGFSFAAMTGKSKIMNLGSIKEFGKRKFFMSSTTHGGETSGIRAALETLKFYKKNSVITHNHSIGIHLQGKCIKIIKELKFEEEVKIGGNPWMLVFFFTHKNKKLIPNVQTLFSQEMIKNGVLIQNSFVPCFSHKKKEINFFLNAFKKTIYFLKSVYSNESELKKISPVKKVFREYV